MMAKNTNPFIPANIPRNDERSSPCGVGKNDRQVKTSPTTAIIQNIGLIGSSISKLR